MINFLKDILANKTRIIAVISLVLLIAQSHGLDLTQYIGADWQTTLTNIFALITLIAIGDNGGVKNEAIQETSQRENNTTLETQVEDTTTAINNEVTQNSVETIDITAQKLEQIKTILNQ
jgi:uncharacterized membrane protein